MPADRKHTGRNAKGQWTKGVSGNPRGRPPLPENFGDLAKKSPQKLREIADDPRTPAKVRADIEKWFAEMWYGKALQQVDLEGKVESQSAVTVAFEGKLEEWSG